MRLFKNILNLFFKGGTFPVLARPDEKNKRKLDTQYEGSGKFDYDDNCFIFQFDEEPQKIVWSDIERLVAYKADLMTIDEIRIDIVYSNLQTTITEEAPGWHQFVSKTKSVYPSIPQDWDTKIMQPAFATNLVILYEREDRVMPKENNFYASFENISKDKIKKVLTNNGWLSRKTSWADFELTNSWTELILEGDGNSPLLHGTVAFHPKNIEILDKVFSSIGAQYTYEFYNEMKTLILEKKSAS